MSALTAMPSWFEQATEQRKAHPAAAVFVPTITVRADLGEMLADLMERGEPGAGYEFPDRGGGVIVWAELPRVGRVRIHLVRQP